MPCIVKGAKDKPEGVAAEEATTDMVPIKMLQTQTGVPDVLTLPEAVMR